MQALDLDVEDKNAIPDAAKAARLLTDIAAVSQEMDLSGLALVEADTEYLETVSQKVSPSLCPNPIIGIGNLDEGTRRAAGHTSMSCMTMCCVHEGTSDRAPAWQGEMHKALHLTSCCMEGFEVPFSGNEWNNVSLLIAGPEQGQEGPEGGHGAAQPGGRGKRAPDLLQPADPARGMPEGPTLCSRSSILSWCASRPSSSCRYSLTLSSE